MKPKNYLITFILILTSLAIITLPSCATRKKTSKTGTTQVPPPPPPPPANEEIPFVVVEEMPMFPGGDSALLAFIARNTKYPEEAKKNGIQGRVIARFCITAQGGVDKISVLKGVSPELDNEAIRVISSLPAFYPGKQGGKPVPVWYMVPITFSLGPKNESAANSIDNQPVLVKTESNNNEPYMEVQEMPVYQGGDTALINFIVKNIVYPSEAKRQGIQGKVIARFCVTKTGSIDRVSVLRGVSPELDMEAIRVIKLLPAFKPGRQDGVPVDVWYTIPVDFKLK